MPLIRAADAPTFEIPFMTATGLAAPRRGSNENSVWRFTIAPCSPGAEHAVTREEIFVALAGRAAVTVDGETRDFTAGDALVVPPDVPFKIAVDGDTPFEAVAILPVGAQAYLPGEAPFSPPWAQ